MRQGRWTRLGPAVAMGALVACADSDNPTALADLQTQVEFEVEAERIETFTEVEIGLHVTESGSPLMMHEARLSIESASGERSVMLEETEHGLEAHVMFFEEGEHHIHMYGTPEGHMLEGEMGDTEIHVHRRHEVVGDYWLEFEASPAPVLPGSATHVHVLAFDLNPDGTRGALASGLEVHAEIHDPTAGEVLLEAHEEEPGEYEFEHTFENAGVYEIHLEIHDGVDEFLGAFHLPVIDPDADSDTGDGHDDGTGGHDDGGGHAH